MAAAAIKHMASNFAKLDKFEGVDFRRWQKKMHFLLSSMSVVYVLTTPIPDDGDDATVDQLGKRVKWDNDDYDSLKAKYMAEDASSKKFLVSDFTNYKMTDSRPVLEQYNELLGILRRFTQHKMNMDESIQVSCIIDKLPPSRKDFKHTLKHLKEELTLVELGSHLHIEESLRMQDSDKPNGNNVFGPSVVNMVEHNNSSRIAKVEKLATKLMVQAQMDYDVARWVESRATVYVCKDRCWFKTYELLNDRSILHIGNESTTLGHRRGCVDLKFSSGKIISLFCINQMFKLNIVNDNIASAFMLTSKLNDSILWHARLGHVHFKSMQDMSKDGLIPTFDMDTKKCKTCMLNKITKKPFQNVKRETKVLELIHSDLCDLHATPLLGNKKYFVTFIDDASRAAVRLPDPKLKTLGERGIECIFIGYTENSKAFRFYVIEPNDSVSINSIIESRDAIFDENRFSTVPRPSLRILNGTEDIGGSVVPKEVTKEVVQQPELELRKSKRNRTPKDFGPEFQLYLIEGTRDEVSDQHSYCFNVEDDPKTFDEAMKSQDFAFWKEAINDEIDSIMGNNTWVLADLPPVAHISTIRLLIAMASIHNLIIHQMDVNTAFLNGDLDEEVYMNQPQCFIMPGNENKVYKLIKSLYGLNKFDETGKGVIICLYVDEMLIFGTDQVQVDLTKKFLSLRFSMKDMGEKVLKKFNYFYCTPFSTPMDTSKKLMPNNGQAVSQLEYSRVIGCLMYAMTCTRPDIAFDVGKLSRYTSNPSTQHWQAIQQVLKYLKKTMDYRLTYTGYPSVLEGYTNASWISNTEDNSSTSG
ncbi:zinc finger, CCHC-type containing protein [Tanacetum coccineum]